jgi:hypothetical protein
MSAGVDEADSVRPGQRQSRSADEGDALHVDGPPHAGMFCQDRRRVEVGAAFANRLDPGAQYGHKRPYCAAVVATRLLEKGECDVGCKIAQR